MHLCVSRSCRWALPAEATRAHVSPICSSRRLVSRICGVGVLVVQGAQVPQAQRAVVRHARQPPAVSRERQALHWILKPRHMTRDQYNKREMETHRQSPQRIRRSALLFVTVAHRPRSADSARRSIALALHPYPHRLQVAGSGENHTAQIYGSS